MLQKVIPKEVRWGSKSVKNTYIVVSWRSCSRDASSHMTSTVWVVVMVTSTRFRVMLHVLSHEIPDDTFTRGPRGVPGRFGEERCLAIYSQGMGLHLHLTAGATPASPRD